MTVSRRGRGCTRIIFRAFPGIAGVDFAHLPIVAVFPTEAFRLTNADRSGSFFDQEGQAMRKVLLGIGVLVLAATAFAQRVDDLNTRQHAQLYPTKDHGNPDQGLGWAKPGGGGAQNLFNHGGPVITSAKVVSIFWGSEWGTNASPSSLAHQMMAFFAGFGTTPEYNTITQYSGIQQTGLTNQYWVDTTNPPTNATDAAVQ